jgi:hypothetical protein
VGFITSYQGSTRDTVDGRIVELHGKGTGRTLDAIDDRVIESFGGRKELNVLVAS